MATVASIINTACQEIGVLAQGETLNASDTAVALIYVENMIDAWQADQLTLSRQLQQAISWPSSTSTQTIGPSGNVNIQRPVWVDHLNYVVPGSSPAVEVPIGQMDADSYAVQSIKSLSSALPLSFFYQQNLSDALGVLFLWPQPNQSLTLYLYAPQGVDTPTSTSSTLIGPPGYQEAFIYQLALRLCNPFGRTPPPMLPALASEAWARMKRPNNRPGLLGVDPALVPNVGGGYNVLTDTNSAWGGH